MKSASALDPRQPAFEFNAAGPLPIDPLDRRQRRRLAGLGVRGALATALGEHLFNIGGAE